MRDNNVVELSSSSKQEKPGVDLFEMIRGDRELVDFFRLIRDYDLREQAVEALKKKLKSA